ncbi:MAG: hypothetical protein ACR2OZ_17875 [Verrucomicrobiales bacterium]
MVLALFFPSLQTAGSAAATARNEEPLKELPFQVLIAPADDDTKDTHPK